MRDVELLEFGEAPDVRRESGDFVARSVELRQTRKLANSGGEDANVVAGDLERLKIG